MPRFSYQDQQLIQNAGTLGYWLDLSEDQLYLAPDFVAPSYVSAISTKTRGWKNQVFCAPNTGSGVDGSALIPFTQLDCAFTTTEVRTNTLYTPGATAAVTPTLGGINNYSDRFNWTYSGVFFQRSDNTNPGKNWLFAGSYLMATGTGRTNGRPREAAAYSGSFQEAAAGAFVTYENGNYTVYLTDSWYSQNFRGSTGRDSNIRFTSFTAPDTEPIIIGLRSRSVVTDDIALGLGTPSTVVHEVELYVNGVFKERATLTYTNALFQNGGIESSSVTAVNQNSENLFANGQSTNPFISAGYTIYGVGAGRDSSGVAVDGWGAVGEVITWQSTLTQSKMTEVADYQLNRWAGKLPAQFGNISNMVGVVGSAFSTGIEVVNADTLEVSYQYAPSPTFTVAPDGQLPDVKNISFQAPTSSGRRVINLTAKDANGYDVGYAAFVVWFTSDGQLSPIQQKIDATNPAIWLDPDDIGSLTINAGQVTQIVDKAFGVPWSVVSPFPLQRDAATFLSTGLRFDQSQLGSDQPTYLQVADAVDKSVFYRLVDGLYVAQYTGVPTQEAGNAQTVLFVTRHDKDSVYDQSAKIHLTPKPVIGSPSETQYGGIGFESPASTNNLDAQLRLVAKNSTDSEDAGSHNASIGYDTNALYLFEAKGFGTSIRANKANLPVTNYLSQQDRLITRLVFSSASTYAPPYITYDTTEPTLGFNSNMTQHAYVQRTSGKFSPIGWKATPGNDPLSAYSTKFALGKEEFYWQFWVAPAILTGSAGADLPVVETVAELAQDYMDLETSVLRLSYVVVSDDTYSLSLSVGQNRDTLITVNHPSVLSIYGGYVFVTIYRKTTNGIDYFGLVVNGIEGPPIQSDVNMTSARMSLGASYNYGSHGTGQSRFSDLRLALGTLTDYTQIPTAVFPTGTPAVAVQPLDAVGLLYSPRGYVTGPFGEVVVILDGAPKVEIAELETLLYNKWIQAPAVPVVIGNPASTSADIGRRFSSTLSITNGTAAIVTASAVSEMGGNWTMTPSNGNGQGIWTISGPMPLTPQTFSVDITAVCDGETVVKTVTMTALNRTLPVFGQISPNFAKRSTSSTPTLFQGTVPVTLGVYDFVSNLGAGKTGLPSANWSLTKDGDGVISLQGQMPQSLSAFEISIDIE